MKSIRNFVKRNTSPLFRVTFLVFSVCVLLLLLAQADVGIADLLNRTVCTWIRFALARVTSVLPFSLGEWILWMLPVAVTFLVCLGVIRFRGREGRVRFLGFLLSVVLIVSSMHVLTLGIAYRTTRADKKLGLSDDPVTAEELYAVSSYLLAKTEAELDGISFSSDGSSVMPYATDELSRRICDAYDALADEYDGLVISFSSKIKPLVASRIMSYAHLLGVYSFYTGESNLNVDYPDYNFPYTTAHEFAHQRGIIREDEANFIAFLVCERSSDAYIRYSGYLNLFEYVANALYRADPESYRELIAGMDDRVRGELIAYNRHYEKYEGTKFGEISEAFNDAYLRFNGTEGAVTYGFVVDLAVSYLHDRAVPVD